MTSGRIQILRYDADEGKVFDYATPKWEIQIDENGEEITVISHLYAKTIFLGVNDSIDNYIEVDEPVEPDEPEEHVAE